MANIDSSRTEYTKYELARIIGARALQISMGAPFLMDFSDKQLAELKYNPIEIAKLEHRAGVLPFDMRRVVHAAEHAKFDEKVQISSEMSDIALSEKEE